MLLRAPFAGLDLGTALLLLRLFRDSPFRYAVFAAYWVHPLALIFSAYHGNTDPAIAFFVLLAVLVAFAVACLAGCIGRPEGVLQVRDAAVVVLFVALLVAIFTGNRRPRGGGGA